MTKLPSTSQRIFCSLLILSLLLPVLSLSNLNPARAMPESTRVPTELVRPNLNAAAGVELSSGYEQIVTPGSIITYTHTITNTGSDPDTYTLDVSSSQGWPVSLLNQMGTLSLPLQLDAGLTATLFVSLSVPTSAISGTIDMAVITATSQTSPTISIGAIDTTTVESVTWIVYLPVILKRWPPIPDVPALNPISNPDNEGYFDVTWNTAYLATSYTLEEDENVAFSSPTVLMTGTATSWSVIDKPGGTYYYRVKAANSWGDSGWSDVQSTTAVPGIHGRITYQGNPIGGVSLFLWKPNRTYIYYYHTTTQADGTYQFMDLPSLQPYETYWLPYTNDASPSFVASCNGPMIYSYVADASLAGGSFDIANIPQTAPASGATVALPYTFQWTKRSGVPADSYMLEIWNAQGQGLWLTAPLGYVSQYTLNALLPGMNYGTQYSWRVRTTAGDCYSFDQNRTVTFSSGMTGSHDAVNELPRVPNVDR